MKTPRKVVSINALATGSTGQVMIDVANTAIAENYDVQLFASTRPEKSTLGAEVINISSRLGARISKKLSQITGLEGYFSIFPTIRLCRKITRYNPDIIHLHVLHNGYINLPILFHYLKKWRTPVVWTMHDCWAFTGHCPHFEYEKCDKWKQGCYACPRFRSYPKTLFDNSGFMWKRKKKWFSNLQNLTIVTPSNWLKNQVRQSYLSDYPVKVIYNGIDTNVFHPSERTSDLHKYTVLGVASCWSKKKGLDVFVELANRLPDHYQIILVGTNEQIDKMLPDNIISIHHTKNQETLARIYSSADVFVNPTREETLGLTNIEANACGIPVVTFHTGGSPECISGDSGVSVDCDDIDTLETEIRRICAQKPYTIEACVARAGLFDKKARFREYIGLYDALIPRTDGS